MIDALQDLGDDRFPYVSISAPGDEQAEDTRSAACHPHMWKLIEDQLDVAELLATKADARKPRQACFASGRFDRVLRFVSGALQNVR